MHRKNCFKFITELFSYYQQQMPEKIIKGTPQMKVFTFTPGFSPVNNKSDNSYHSFL